MSRKGDNVYLRKDTGKWTAKFRKGRKQDGRIIYGYVSDATREGAIRKKDEAEKAFRLESGIARDPLLLKEIADRWLQDLTERGRKESTISSYRYDISSHIEPAFGDRLVTEIGEDELRDFFQEKLEKYAVSTVKQVRTVLNMLFRYAEKENALKLVDFDRIPIGGGTFIEARAMSRAERETLVRYLVKKYPDDPSNFMIAVMLMLYTGIRVGELCAVRWKDIDLAKGILKISRTVRRVQAPDGSEQKTRVIITPPKSRRSEREIYLHDGILKVLKSASGRKSGYILKGRDRDFTEPRTVEKKLSGIYRELGIQNAGCHTLRHSFATAMVESGGDSKIASRILGHSSVAFTLKMYYHPSEETTRMAINRLPGFEE